MLGLGKTRGLTGLSGSDLGLVVPRSLARLRFFFFFFFGTHVNSVLGFSYYGVVWVILNQN